MRHVLLIVAVAVLISGCGARIVPQPLPGSIVNPADRSLSSKTKDVTVTARVQDLDVVPYRSDSIISSFYLAVINGTSAPLTLQTDSFILLDAKGTQYSALPPSAVLADASSAGSPPLIPYPYVGFYYLEDFEKFGFFNTFTSALPYYADAPTPHAAARALRVENLIPGARAGGEIYFPVDLTALDSFELRLYLPPVSAAAPPRLRLPLSR